MKWLGLTSLASFRELPVPYVREIVRAMHDEDRRSKADSSEDED